MEDDALSVHTVSSSGISDGDVTILRDSTDNALAVDIEQQLEQGGYVVAKSLCAGRTVTENIISRDRHSKFIVVLLSVAARKYLESLEFLQLETKKLTTTLLLYEKGFQKNWLKRHHKSLIGIRRCQAPEDIAQQIASFIESQARGEHRPSTLGDAKRNFVDHIIGSVVDSLSGPLLVEDVEQRLEEKHGLFTEIDSDGFTSHLDKSDRFCLNGDEIKIKPVPSDTPDNTFALRDKNSLCDNTRAVVSDLEDTTSCIENWSMAVECAQSHSLDEKLKPLSDQLGNLDERFSYFLFSGHPADVESSSKYLPYLLEIPWLRVCDFDRNSRDSGILSLLETKLKEQRAITISSDSADLVARGTDWCFPLGTSDAPDQLIDDNVMEWYTSNKTILGKQFQQIATFCTCVTIPIVTILWYGCSVIETRCLDWCLSLLFTKVSSKTSKIRVILFTDQSLDSTGPLQQMVEKYQLQNVAKQVSLSSVCQWLASAGSYEEKIVGKVQLPCKCSETSRVDISKEDVAWIEKMIELLPLEYSDKPEPEFCRESELEFLKGGIVLWKDLSTGLATICRDTQLLMHVNDLKEGEILTDRKSLTLSVCHEPGAGGSTLGRQLLWDLHREVPCGVVRCSDSLNELADRVKLLQEQTFLPIALLVDGKTEREVSHILDTCKYGIVIIHVQRFSSNELKSSYNPDTKVCQLPGRVSKEEAKKLNALFSKLAPKKSSSLKSLTACAHLKNCHVFEYGLTAFDYEYKGLRSYVQGYLQPPSSSSILDLHPDQKVVSYLSLALYYGQDGLPREIFRNLLSVHGYKFVTLEEVNSPCKQLIRAQKLYWKIEYYQIAKEILDQVLCGVSGSDGHTNGDLSNDARAKLHHLVIEFIKMLKDAVQDERPQFVQSLLSKMLIHRDKRGNDKTRAYGQHSPLSRLLEDIPNSENRIEVLQELSCAFPEHYQFHAHLGRLLGILCRFDDAEHALDTALTVLSEECCFSKKTFQNDRGQTHNMFGYVCLKRVSYELKKLPKEEPMKVVMLLDLAQKAIDHFKQGRKYVTYNLSYGYIGEIKVRLAIAKYAQKNLPGGCGGVFRDSSGPEHVRLKNFIEQSRCECGFLLDRCYYDTPPEELKGVRDFDRCKGDYAFCFGDLRNILNQPNSVDERRSEIANLKLNRDDCKNQYISEINKIKDRDKVRRIIALHEKNFQEVFNRNLSYNITIDVLEWLDALRHRTIEKDYVLEENILPILRNWNRSNKSIHSTYYLYIVHYVLAMYTRDLNRHRHHNQRAKELRESLREKRHDITCKPLNQEVLAQDDKLTIRKLLCAGRGWGRGKGNKYWLNHCLVDSFQPCTGTIVHSKDPRYGIIRLDVSFSSEKMEVFFIPLEYDLSGKRYTDEKTKVEFFLRFSVERGAEAIAIKKLTKGVCVNCHQNNCILTLNQKEKNCISCFNNSLSRPGII